MHILTMAKNKDSWKNAFWILLALVFLFFLGFILNTVSYSSNGPNYEQASQEWGNYANLLNADIEKIHSIRENECDNTKTYQEINNCISSLSPRLQVYKSHLEQARSFLNTKGDAFSNNLELQANIDDQLVWVVGFETQLSSFINEYNSNIQSQKDQQEALLNLLKILAGGI